MKRVKAFILGMREARSDVTTHIDGPGEDAYEYGRRFAWWFLGIH